MATEKTGSGAATPADPKASETKAGATVEAEVAPGRTLTHDGKRYRAGDAVSLPADEVERLRELGYLKSDEPPAPAGRTDAGVSVKASEAASTTKPKGAS